MTTSNAFHKSYSGVTKNKSDSLENKFDYYPTPPIATYALIRHFGHMFGNSIWEPAAGRGWIVKELELTCNNNFSIFASDVNLYDNPVCNTPIQQHDFFDFENIDYSGFSALITNPPYKSNLSLKFAQLALYYKIPFIALLQRLTFVEGQSRYANLFSKTPPSNIMIMQRLCCNEAQCLENMHKNQQKGMIVYAWYIWANDYVNDMTTVHWANMKSIYEDWNERYKNGY